MAGAFLKTQKIVGISSFHVFPKNKDLVFVHQGHTGFYTSKYAFI